MRSYAVLLSKSCVFACRRRRLLKAAEDLMLKALTAGKRCRKVVFGSNEAPPFLLSTVPLLKDMNAVGVKNQAAGYEVGEGAL